jgi:Trypsin
MYGSGIDHPDSATEPLPCRLQQLESRVITKARCTDVAISTKEICVENPNGTDGICFGDSGGPPSATPRPAYRSSSAACLLPTRVLTAKLGRR